MNHADIWALSPAQIIRFARNRNLIRAADHKHDIAMAWLNAVLQRAKKVPALKKLTPKTKDGSKPISLATIVQRLNQAGEAGKDGRDSRLNSGSI